MSTLAKIDQHLSARIQSRLFKNPQTETLADIKKNIVKLMLLNFIAVHACFFTYFAYLSVTTMAVFNVFSVGYYFFFYHAHRSKWLQQDTILLLTIVEVCAHALTATYHIGWTSGFPVYPLICAASIICFSGSSLLMSLSAALTILVTVATNDAFFSHQLPLHTIDPEILNLSRLINHLLALTALAITVIYLHLLLSSVDHSLQKLANEDQLTGLNNRRAMATDASRTIESHRAVRAPVCVAIGDIDHFKNINDTYGHSTGDAVLVEVAYLLQSEMREGDLLARWGGEEFAWVLPNSSLSSSYTAMERIRLAVEALQPETSDGKLSLSLTIGIAEVLPHENFDHAIERADHALYQGKNLGRNQVNVALSSITAAIQQTPAQPSQSSTMPPLI